ncbi:MAG: SH3 domain-containing protein [Bacillus sp. (in: firmicutes)]
MNKIPLFLFIGICSIFLTYSQLGEATAAQVQSAVVKADKLRIRSAPDQNSKVVGTLKFGEKVQVQNQQEGWAEIAYGETKGWVSADYLKQKAESGVVLASSLHVRSEPNSTADVIGAIKKGTHVDITSESNGWYYIESGGLAGWASSVYIESADKNRYVTVGKQYYVDATSLNVRAEATSASRIVGSLPTSKRVTVVAVYDYWAKIESEKVSGWVASQYLSTVDKSTQATTDLSTEEVVLLKNSNLRTGPGTEYDIVRLAKAGTAAMKISSSKDWFQIRLSDGTVAWVASWLTGPPQSHNVRSTSSSLAGKTIVIDPGHGGRDPGAVGKYNKEKALTLGTAVLLADKLNGAGAEVVMTRDKDEYISLHDRVRISHKNDADLFISLHYNAGSASRSGVMSFFYNNSDKELAMAIQEQLVSHTKLKDAGTGLGDFLVLRSNRQPAVLLELGFLSNEKEESVIATKLYQQKTAKGIYRGIINYFAMNK